MLSPARQPSSDSRRWSRGDRRPSQDDSSKPLSVTEFDRRNRPPRTRRQVVAAFEHHTYRLWHRPGRITFSFWLEWGKNMKRLNAGECRLKSSQRLDESSVHLWHRHHRKTWLSSELTEQISLNRFACQAKLVL